MNRLVQSLTKGKHPVILGGSQTSLAELKRQVKDAGYIFITFSETQGGTKLGINVDAYATDLSQADFDRHAGSIHIEGTLVLDYTSVRCIADIDLATLTGLGCLAVLEATVAQ